MVGGLYSQFALRKSEQRHCVYIVYWNSYTVYTVKTVLNTSTLSSKQYITRSEGLLVLTVLSNPRLVTDHLRLSSGEREQGALCSNDPVRLA